MAAKNKFFLLFLSEVENKQVKAILERSTKPQILAIREVVVNLLNSVIPITDVEKKKISKHKTFFRQLAHKSQSRCKISHKSKAIKDLMVIARPVLLQL